MGYIVAKFVTKPSSTALRKWPVNNISDAEYANKLEHKYLGTGIEILTIGSFDIYTEYTPLLTLRTVRTSKEKLKRCI